MNYTPNTNMVSIASPDELLAELQLRLAAEGSTAVIVKGNALTTPAKMRKALEEIAYLNSQAALKNNEVISISPYVRDIALEALGWKDGIEE